MNDADSKLLALSDGFSDAVYLAFLAERVPPNLAEQLTRDAHPELMLDKHVEVTDLMKPLLSKSFPADCASRSTAVFRLAGVLEYTLSGYVIDIEKNAQCQEPYKQIYVASFYLYCCLHGAMRSHEYVGALLVLVNAAAHVPVAGQFQVSRFIGSLIPILPKERVADPAPLSSALIAMSLIVASALNDLSLLAERAIDEEDFAQAWIKREAESEEGYPSLDSMRLLRRSVSAFFGPSGRLAQISDRFREVADQEKTRENNKN